MPTTNMNNHLLQIKELSLLKTVGRLLAISWTVIAYMRFEANPVFFAVSGVLALSALFFVTDTSITATKKGLIIRKKAWIPVLNKKEEINYYDISGIWYEKAKNPHLLAFLTIADLIPGTYIWRESKLKIYRKKEETVLIPDVGSSAQNELLLELVKKRIRE